MLLCEIALQVLEVRRNARLRTFRRSSKILNRPGDCLAQLSRGTQRPIGVAQHFAGEEHGVGLTRGEHVLGLYRRGDHTHRPRQDSGFASNALGKCRLIARSNGYFGGRHVAAGRAVDEIDSHRLQLTRQFYRLLEVPAAFGPIRTGQAYEERRAFRPNRAHRGDHFAQEARPVFE